LGLAAWIRRKLQDSSLDIVNERAAVSHGWGICCGVEPLSELESVLYAIDELTGLVTTSALVRLSRSVLHLPSNQYFSIDFCVLFPDVVETTLLYCDAVRIRKDSISR
jgi:hypothetical protein